MTRNRPLDRSLAESIELVVDEGVVDSWVRISVVDLDIREVTVEGRMETASFDTRSRYA